MGISAAYASVCVALALVPGVAAGDLRFLGAIEGKVRNANGITQMGATVLLLNKQDKLLHRALTTADGTFRFDSLIPDSYNIRVSLASFVPAYRSNIMVQAGAESVLTVQLANMFSSIELVYRAPGSTGLIADDWKYALRSSAATRPVLRMLPGADPNLGKRTESLFSDTRGLVRLTAGDSANMPGSGQEADLGTAFAVATSLFGSNEIHLSGNVGYSTSLSVPATGFRTRYSPGSSGILSPEVELTVQQVTLRSRVGGAMWTGVGAAPELKTMSVKMQEKTALTDDIILHYGLMLESVVFLDRANIFSPFAHLTWNLGNGKLEAAYSSGAPPLSLLESSSPEGDIRRDLTGLGVFPRVSMRGGRPAIQGVDTLELAYSHRLGGNTFAAAAYAENVRNGVLTMSAPSSWLTPGEVTPDLGSSGYIYNIGTYRSTGYLGSYSRQISNRWSAALIGGYGGTLTPFSTGEPISEISEARTRFRPVRSPWASARVAGQLPAINTRVAATYGWAANNVLAPPHSFLTQRFQQQIGLNLQVRQALPGFGLAGRLEMSAEVRNLMAQGYVPVRTMDGGTIVFMQYPKTVRGGLSLIF